jgi:hypothetical protein
VKTAIGKQQTKMNHIFSPTIQHCRDKTVLTKKKTMKDLQKLDVISRQDVSTVEAGGLLTFTRSSVIAVSRKIGKS